MKLKERQGKLNQQLYNFIAMLHRYCSKNIFLLFLSTLFWNGLSAQDKTISTVFAPFITGADTINPNQFLVLGSAATIFPALQKKQLTVLRQLNDSVYIIRTNDLNSLGGFKKYFPANNNWKLSPSLLSKKQISWPATFLVSVQNENTFKGSVVINGVNAAPTGTQHIFLISAGNRDILNKLLNDVEVIFISEYNKHPIEELQINTLDLSVNKINLLHSKSPILNGNGLVISIKENKPDTTDIDLTGRYISNALAATAINAHATIMATMAAGAGNSYYLGKGVAWGASITSSNFSNLLPDPDANYAQSNITVQNHSYGVGIENFYGADAAAYDASALINDKLVFVFSAGNSGTATPSTGNYAGIPGVANLTGSFKMAKNIITVGSVDSFSNVVAPSSKGPAYDGRIKPEMVAYGEDGSSGAASLVSGTSIVLQQAYKNNGGILPPSSLVKAILLNSADDVAAPGIDFNSGFGNLNAFKAAEGMITQKYFMGTVSNNGSQIFPVTIPANISKAKFTLVWNDAAAAANAFKAIKNDLDIQLQSNATSQVWLPWVLNSFAHKDSLALLPLRKRDSLNTAEQVSIDAPAPGNYSIIINGFNVSTASQPFAIAYQFDTANVFTWVLPGFNDNIFPAAANVIRWQSTFAPGNAILDYSINNGTTWLPVSATINPAAKFFKWNAPDTTAIALLRMTINSQQFISDPFTISAKPDLNIGFNCADSVMLYWNKNKAITNYQLYVLGNKYLQPLTTIPDTQFIFNKASLPYQDFAVAPIINNRTGVKSYTTNYNKQGVDCYIKNLLADLFNSQVNINLAIGTTYLIKKIVFEKLKGNSFILLSETSNINGLNYAATDLSLQKGINTYRVAIYLINGKIIYSDTVAVVYFSGNEILLYPNPVLQNSDIYLQLKDIKNQTLSVIDMQGRLVFQKKLSVISYSFPAGFAKGLYIISVFDPETGTTQFSKLIVQ